MVQTYYKCEYTQEEWRRLVDKCEELGVSVEYGKYGDRAVLDSTNLEDRILERTNNVNNSWHRQEWAKHIHETLEKAARG